MHVIKFKSHAIESNDLIDRLLYSVAVAKVNERHLELLPFKILVEMPQSWIFESKDTIRFYLFHLLWI